MPQRTLADLAQLCGAALEGDGTRLVSGPADLAGAGRDEVSFLANERYAALVESTRAAAVVLARGVQVARDDLALLRVDDPNTAFTAIVSAFAESEAPPPAGIHPSAVVHESVQLGAAVAIGPLCSVGADAQLGDGAVLRAGVCVGAGAKIGPRTVLHTHVSLYPRVQIGADCILHAGSVIGSDGLGFEPSPEGWDKIPQCGTVIIEDEVEIGANCAIDRGRFGATLVRRGAKLDNLVHIAHNVVIGEASLLCAQVGLSGSVTLGQRVIMGGQSAVAGHLAVPDGVQIGGQAAVASSPEPGQEVTGTPARPLRQTRKDAALVRKLPELKERLAALEGRLAELESRSDEQ